MVALDSQQQFLEAVDLFDVLLPSVDADEPFQHVGVLVVFAVAVQKVLLGVVQVVGGFVDLDELHTTGVVVRLLNEGPFEECHGLAVLAKYEHDVSEIVQAAGMGRIELQHHLVEALADEELLFLVEADSHVVQGVDVAVFEFCGALIVLNG